MGFPASGKDPDSSAERSGHPTPQLNHENIIQTIFHYILGLINLPIGHTFLAIVPSNTT